MPVDYNLYPHLDRTEFLEGKAFAVEAYSLWGKDYFVLANENSGLHIFQIVDGEVVQVGVGDALGAERDVAIKDWYAFVATGSGLSVMNVAVAENPYRAGFLNLTGEPVRVEVSATHAFVACGSGGLVVVDITNPESMFVVGNYGTEVKSVCLDGDRLGIVHGDRFEILDVSVPGTPILLGFHEIGSMGAYDKDSIYGYKDAVLQGDRAYVLSRTSVEQLDITDPGSITATMELPLQYYTRLEIQGPDLVFSGAHQLAFVDFATGNVTRETEQVGSIRDVAFLAGKIMAAGEGRVEIFDDGLHLNPPAGIVEDAVLMEPRGIMLGDILYGLSLSAENTLVATELGAEGGLLWNLDLETDGTLIKGMAHQGTTVVTLTGLGSLSVVTVSRNGAVLRGTLEFLDGFSQSSKDRTVAFLDDQTLVVLDANYVDPYFRNIRVVDISNLEQPVQIGQYPLTVSAALHIMKAGTLIIATSWGDFEVFDAQDRLSLEPLGVHHIGGRAHHRVYARDSWLYALHASVTSPPWDVGPDRLDVWDLSNPMAPVIVNELDLVSSGNLVFAGDWAYQEGSGLILDFSDPAQPGPAGNFSQPRSSDINHVVVLAGSEYIVADYIPYGEDQGSYAQFMAAQGATGGVSSVDDGLPMSGLRMTLQAVPNPFNPRVTLQFDLPAASVAHLEIFDLRGRRVADLGEKLRQAGPQSETWDGLDPQGRSLPSGVYLARVMTPDRSASRKIVLAR